MKFEFTIESAEDAELASDVCTFVAGQLGGYDTTTGEVTTAGATATGRGSRRGGKKTNADKDRLAEAQGESALKPGAALAGESASSLADALKGSQVVTEQGGVTVHTTGTATADQVADMKAKLEGGQAQGGTTTGIDIFASATPQGQTNAVVGTPAADTKADANLSSMFNTAGNGAANVNTGTVSGAATGDMAALFGKQPPAASPFDTMSKEELDRAIFDYVNTTGGMSWGRAALSSLNLRTFNDLTADQIRVLLKDPTQVKVS